MKKDPTRKMTDDLTDSERVKGIYLAMKQGDEPLALELLSAVKKRINYEMRIIFVKRSQENGQWVDRDYDENDPLYTCRK